MNRLPMSPTAAALLRQLIARAEVPRDRILLTVVQSTDWRSLTFAGERHELQLRVPGPGSREVADRMCGGLEEAEISIPGAIVADIRVCRLHEEEDASTSVTIESLTVAAD